MNFFDLKNKIAALQTNTLGGLEAQFRLAPKMRRQYDAASIQANNPRKAAVLALFYPDTEGKACFLLIQRARYNGTHSAQISFPGGKIDKSDKNLKKAALRETFEEVGVLESSINIIRELTDVYIPPSNFLVTPFIGFVDKRPVFDLNYEVDKVIEVLLSDLLNDSNITSINMSTSYMDNVNIPCFKLNDYIIWGATAMILSEIKELLK